jgi:hypothetical protein
LEDAIEERSVVVINEPIGTKRAAENNAFSDPSADVVTSYCQNTTIS